MSNASQSLRNYFSRYSEIRKNDSSNGAILFDGLWSELETYVRSQATLSNNLFSFKKDVIISKDRFWKWNDADFEIKSNETPIVSDYRVVDNIYEAFKSLETGYVKYTSPKTIKNKRVFFTITEETNDLESKTIEGKVYLDVINFSNFAFEEGLLNNEKVSSKIILRGVDWNNEYIEEEVVVNEEGFYESTKEFLFLQEIPQNFERKTSGGKGISVHGASNYKINVSNKSFRQWEPVDSESSAYKKIFKTNLLSIVENYDLEGVFTGAITENFAAYHVNKDSNGKAKISFIHRYFLNNYEYKNLSYEDLLEEVEVSLFDGNLVNRSIEEIEFIDFCYSEKYSKLFGLGKDNKLYGYSLSKPSFVIGAFDRSTKSDLRIEIDNKYPVPSEISQENSEINLKVLTSSPDFYIEKYVIFKHKRTSDSYEFVNYINDEYSWGDSASILNGIANLDDYQDTIKAFELTDTASINEEQVDYYIVSLRKKSEEYFSEISSESNEQEIKRALALCEEEGSSIYRNSIALGVLKPYFEYDLNIGYVLNEESLISFNNLNGNLLLLENETAYEFYEQRKYCIYDKNNIYTLSDESSLEVSLNSVSKTLNTKEEILISTKLDSSGAVFGIERALKEPLERFRDRVRFCSEERVKPIEIKSFDKALLYKVNSNANKELVITDKNKVLKNFKILNEAVIINNTEYPIKKEFKFLKDLCTKLDDLNITYEKLENYEEYKLLKKS